MAIRQDTVEKPVGLYVWIQINSIVRYSVLKLFVRIHFLLEFNSNSHNWHDWDGQTGGWTCMHEFADFKSLSAAVVQLENSLCTVL